MRWRDVYLEKETIISQSGTITVDIDVKQPIVAIDLIFDGVFGGTACEADKKLYEDVDKIEIIDGSDVLFSLSAEKLLALNCFELKHFPHVVIDNEIDGVEQFKATIFFGRNYFDTEYMLDPSRFLNPQLKITYSFTEGASNWLANNQKVSVIARVCEEPPTTIKGFMMSKEVYSWTTATSGDETIDMPRDYLYRMILCRKDYTGERADEGITNVKLSCDMDRFVPVNMKGSHLGAENQMQFGEFRLVQKQDMTDDEIMYTPLSKTLYAEGQTALELKVVHFDAIDGEACTIVIFKEGAAGSDAWVSDSIVQQITANVCGTEPFFTLCVPFGDLWDVAEYFDPTPYASVRLILTQGGTSGTGEVMIQQVRTY